MAVELERRPISKISLAIDSGHNIRPAIQGFLGSGFQVKFVENGGIHAKVQNDPLLGSVTLYHGQDISDRLLAGNHNFGIVGRDRLLEAQLGGADLKEVVALGRSGCDVVLEVPQWSKYRKPEDLDGKRIATSLPNTALDYFGKHNAEVTIVNYRGKEEGAPRAGVADGVVAIWVTGGTAKENNLRRMKEPILQSEAVLVASGRFLEERGSERIVSQFVEKVRQTAEPLEPLTSQENRGRNRLNGLRALVKRIVAPLRRAAAVAYTASRVAEATRFLLH